MDMFDYVCQIINWIIIQIIAFFLLSRSVRFRWFQHAATNHPNPDQRWAVDDITISPKCLHMCNGHGSCDYPQCNCDVGFGDGACENTLENLPVSPDD